MAPKKSSMIPMISRFSLMRSVLGFGKEKDYRKFHILKESWMKRLGSIIRYPAKPALVEIYDPGYIGILLRADEKWPERPVLPLMSQAIKRGHLKPSISHVNGAEWAEIRGKMQKIFLTPGAASQFYNAQLEVCEEFVSALLCQQGKHSDCGRGSVSDLRTWACRFAAESVGRILVGGKLRSFSDDKQSPGSQLCDHMDRLFQFTAAGMLQPPWSNWIETKLYKQWMVEYRESKLLVEELISKYGFQQQPTNHTNNADHSDRQPAGQSCGIHTFFSELLSNQQLTVQEAVDFAEELFIAGVESTGNALTFLIYHLAKHPPIQDTLYKEIKSQSGDDGNINLQNFSQLPYLKACMKESMRLSPPVTGTVRVTTNDLILGDYHIPSGTVVNTGSDIICHMGKYFKDPHEFRPERWLGGSRKDIVPFSYIPFGFGARMCIGRRFAEQEIMLAIAVLVLRSTVTLKDPDLNLQRVSKVFFSPDKLVSVTLTPR